MLINRKYTVIALILTVLLASALNASAEEELKAKDVTIYVVYKAPINESREDVFYFDPEYVSSGEMSPYKNPSEYRNDKYYSTLADLNFSTSDSFEYGDIEIFYDGFWLIGIGKVESTADFKNLSELKNWSNEVSRIGNQVWDFSKSKNITAPTPTHPVLTVIQFSNISPTDIYDNKNSKPANASKIDIYDEYKKRICIFLNSPKYCEYRLLATEYPTEDHTNVYLRLPVDPSRPHNKLDYGVVILIHPTGSLDNVKHFLEPISYLIYGQGMIDYSQNLSINSHGLEPNISALRSELLRKPGSLTDLDMRVLSIEEQFDKIKEDLLKIKEYYANRDYDDQEKRINEIRYDKRQYYLLFEEETIEEGKELNQLVSEAKLQLDIAQIRLDQLLQNYNSERALQKADEAIKRSDENNAIIILLAIFTIFTSIIINQGDRVFIFTSKGRTPARQKEDIELITKVLLFLVFVPIGYLASETFEKNLMYLPALYFIVILFFIILLLVLTKKSRETDEQNKTNEFLGELIRESKSLSKSQRESNQILEKLLKKADEDKKEDFKPAFDHNKRVADLLEKIAGNTEKKKE